VAVSKDSYFRLSIAFSYTRSLFFLFIESLFCFSSKYFSKIFVVFYKRDLYVTWLFKSQYLYPIYLKRYSDIIRYLPSAIAQQIHSVMKNGGALKRSVDFKLHYQLSLLTMNQLCNYTKTRYTILTWIYSQINTV